MELINRDELKRKFIEKSKKVHKGENLDYSKVEYINNKTPVIIIDRDLKPDGTEYGEYSILPISHLKGQKHPEKKGFKTKDEWFELVEEMKKVHKGENLEYPEQTFKNKNTKIRIIDHDKDGDGNEYGEYYQTILSHLKGSCHPRKSQQKRRNNEETKTGKTELDETALCKEYTERKSSIRDLSSKYHVGELKIKEILKRNGIELKKRGGQTQENNFIVSDPKTKKYVEREGYHFIARDRKTRYETNDIYNNAGLLTKHIENEYGVDIPKLLEREKYYQRTGNYWWEQWFDIIEVEDKPIKKCPYCDWTTTDLENKSGMFETHLKKTHNISKIEYIEQHPEEKEYFTTVNKFNQRQMENDESKFVICKECGMKMAWINTAHLRTHGMTRFDYIMKYPMEKRTSDEHFKNYSKIGKKWNKTMTFHKSSSRENEIKEFLKGLGLNVKSDRTILDGMEIDLYVPELKIGIEYNGVKWHTEKYGKDKQYHLSKTIKCNEKGVRLIQIFEDEYELHKELVLEKLKHILNKSDGEKVGGRKVSIKEITKNEAEKFLETYHIQGFVSSTVYIGSFYKENLIGVMCFTNDGGAAWTLTRFATDYKYVCQGVGGKMLSYFKKNYNFISIKSFADRRWTTDISDNMYTRLGFVIDEILQPDYSYYNSKVDRYKRFHKFLFRKQSLSKKYGFPMTMTEREMTRELGYDRIWNCGLVKYVYQREDNEKSE